MDCPIKIGKEISFMLYNNVNGNIRMILPQFI